MRRADLIGGIVILVFSLCMIFVVIPTEMQEGIWHGLSPYFVPTLLMSGIALASILLIIQAARNRGGDARPVALGGRQITMFALAGMIVLLGAVTIDFFGIWVGGPPLIAGLMLFMGERRPIRIAVTSVLPVAVVYVVVLYVLRSPLP